MARFGLVCFPFAGGGTAAYRPWLPLLPPDLELRLVQLPGREARFREPLSTDLEHVAAGISHALSQGDDRPLILFGHSMGGLLAFEVARRLSQHGRPPALLIVSGRRPPHLPRKNRLHDLPEAEFVGEVQRLNGTPIEVLRNAELMQLLVPILRADLRLDETHAVQPGPQLRCPILALGGRQDPLAPESALSGWADWTSGPFRQAMCDGDHFFVLKQRNFVLSEIAAQLPHLASGPAGVAFLPGSEGAPATASSGTCTPASPSREA